jgi:hypothetical protein
MGDNFEQRPWGRYLRFDGYFTIETVLIQEGMMEVSQRVD